MLIEASKTDLSSDCFTQAEKTCFWCLKNFSSHTPHGWPPPSKAAWLFVMWSVDESVNKLFTVIDPY